MKLINDYMRKKKEGLTLGEKIEKHLKKVKKMGLVELIDDTFFGVEEEKGCSFHVRRGDLMKDFREKNIIDEIE